MTTNAVKGDVIGFGAATLDFYSPLGVVSPDYVPGEKVAWHSDQPSLTELMYGDYERHVGGNVFNVLAYMARQETYQSVGFVSVLGECEISEQILAHTQRLGIDSSRVVTDPDYRASISVIEREEGMDRMVRGKPRQPIDGRIGDGIIGPAAESAGLVIAASLKDIELTTRIFERVPEDTPLSYNPGSSEFSAYPDDLRHIMASRRPLLLSLNETEIAQLLGESGKKRSLEEIASLVRSTTEYADFVLCTAGTDGAILAGPDDELLHHPARLVRPTDTLGAGDRAHAVTIHGLMQGQPRWKILGDVADSTSQVVQSNGAHGDLYKGIYV